MTSVRKRTWKRGATTCEAWLVDYRDTGGNRRAATFDTRKSAETFKSAIEAATAMATIVAPKSDKPPRLTVVWGVRAIGEAIGLNERQTYHKLSKGQIPGARKDGTWSLDLQVFREAYQSKGA